MITRLPINEQGRDWIVGDIHGELILLKQMAVTGISACAPKRKRQHCPSLSLG